MMFLALVYFYHSPPQTITMYERVTYHLRKFTNLDDVGSRFLRISFLFGICYDKNATHE